VKALRLVLLGEIHPAVVTTADFDQLDGLCLDAALVEAAGFVEHEKVELYDSGSGTRLSLQLRRGKAGEVAVCGAAAVLIKPGTRVTIASFGWMKPKPALKHQPSIVRVDEENQPLKKAKAG